MPHMYLRDILTICQYQLPIFIYHRVHRELNKPLNDSWLWVSTESRGKFFFFFHFGFLGWVVVEGLMCLPVHLAKAAAGSDFH